MTKNEKLVRDLREKLKNANPTTKREIERAEEMFGDIVGDKAVHILFETRDEMLKAIKEATGRDFDMEVALGAAPDNYMLACTVPFQDKEGNLIPIICTYEELDFKLKKSINFHKIPETNPGYWDVLKAWRKSFVLHELVHAEQLFELGLEEFHRRGCDSTKVSKEGYIENELEVEAIKVQTEWFEKEALKLRKKYKGC